MSVSPPNRSPHMAIDDLKIGIQQRGTRTAKGSDSLGPLIYFPITKSYGIVYSTKSCIGIN